MINPISDAYRILLQTKGPNWISSINQLMQEPEPLAVNLAVSFLLVAKHIKTTNKAIKGGSQENTATGLPAKIDELAKNIFQVFHELQRRFLSKQFITSRRSITTGDLAYLPLTSSLINKHFKRSLETQSLNALFKWSCEIHQFHQIAFSNPSLNKDFVSTQSLKYQEAVTHLYNINFSEPLPLTPLEFFEQDSVKFFNTARVLTHLVFPAGGAFLCTRFCDLLYTFGTVMGTPNITSFIQNYFVGNILPAKCCEEYRILITAHFRPTFQDFVIKSSIAYLEETLRLQLSPLVKDKLTTLFQDEQVRSDFIYLVAYPEKAYWKNPTNDFHKLLLTIKIYQSFISYFALDQNELTTDENNELWLKRSRHPLCKVTEKTGSFLSVPDGNESWQTKMEEGPYFEPENGSILPITCKNKWLITFTGTSPILTSQGRTLLFDIIYLRKETYALEGIHPNTWEERGFLPFFFNPSVDDSKFQEEPSRKIEKNFADSWNLITLLQQFQNDPLKIAPEMFNILLAFLKMENKNDWSYFFQQVYDHLKEIPFEMNAVYAFIQENLNKSKQTFLSKEAIDRFIDDYREIFRLLRKYLYPENSFKFDKLLFSPPLVITDLTVNQCRSSELSSGGYKSFLNNLIAYRLQNQTLLILSRDYFSLEKKKETIAEQKKQEISKSLSSRRISSAHSFGSMQEEKKEEISSSLSSNSIKSADSFGSKCGSIEEDEKKENSTSHSSSSITIADSLRLKAESMRSALLWIQQLTTDNLKFFGVIDEIKPSSDTENTIDKFFLFALNHSLPLVQNLTKEQASVFSKQALAKVEEIKRKYYLKEDNIFSLYLYFCIAFVSDQSTKIKELDTFIDTLKKQVPTLKREAIFLLYKYLPDPSWFDTSLEQFEETQKTILKGMKNPQDSIYFQEDLFLSEQGEELLLSLAQSFCSRLENLFSKKDFERFTIIMKQSLASGCFPEMQPLTDYFHVRGPSEGSPTTIHFSSTPLETHRGRLHPMGFIHQNIYLNWSLLAEDTLCFNLSILDLEEKKLSSSQHFFTSNLLIPSRDPEQRKEQAIFYHTLLKGGQYLFKTTTPQQTIAELEQDTKDPNLTQEILKFCKTIKESYFSLFLTGPKTNFSFLPISESDLNNLKQNSQGKLQAQIGSHCISFKTQSAEEIMLEQIKPEDLVRIREEFSDQFPSPLSDEEIKRRMIGEQWDGRGAPRDVVNQFRYLTLMIPLNEDETKHLEVPVAYPEILWQNTAFFTSLVQFQFYTLVELSEKHKEVEKEALYRRFAELFSKKTVETPLPLKIGKLSSVLDDILMDNRDKEIFFRVNPGNGFFEVSLKLDYKAISRSKSASLNGLASKKSQNLFSPRPIHVAFPTSHNYTLETLQNQESFKENFLFHIQKIINLCMPPSRSYSQLSQSQLFSSNPSSRQTSRRPSIEEKNNGTLNADLQKNLLDLYQLQDDVSKENSSRQTSRRPSFSEQEEKEDSALDTDFQNDLLTLYQLQKNNDPNQQTSRRSSISEGSEKEDSALDPDYKEDLLTLDQLQNNEGESKDDSTE